jgi:hypothetical protein
VTGLKKIVAQVVAEQFQDLCQCASIAADRLAVRPLVAELGFVRRNLSAIRNCSDGTKLGLSDQGGGKREPSQLEDKQPHKQDDHNHETDGVDVTHDGRQTIPPSSFA